MSNRLPKGDALARWASLVAATSLLFAVAGVALTALVNRGHWEQATIGLTTNSEWPLHDVHLATTAGALDDPELVRSVQAELGLDAGDSTVELDRQRQGGNGVVTVAARASNAPDAAALANGVAEAMVERVQSDTPVRLVDRADGTSETASNVMIAASGALIGALVGLVVWSPAGRRPTDVP